MSQISYRLRIPLLALLCSFPNIYGATLFENPLTSPQGSSLTQYKSGTTSQTSTVLKAKLQRLLSHQKPLNDVHSINTDGYDSKTYDVFKALFYKK